MGNGKAVLFRNNRLRVCDVGSDICEDITADASERWDDVTEVIFVDDGIAFIGDVSGSPAETHVYKWGAGALEQIDEHLPSEFLPYYLKPGDKQILVAGCNVPCGDGLALWSYDTDNASAELVTSVLDGGFAPGNAGAALYNVLNDGYEVWSYENGQNNLMAEDALLSVSPFEERLVYFKPERKALAGLVGTTETILHDAVATGLSRNGSFVFFSAAGNLAQDHIWTIDLASDKKSQVTNFGSTSLVRATNPSGDIMLENNHNIYLASSSKVKRKIRSALIGKNFWDAGSWYATIDNTLYRVDTADYTRPSASSITRTTPYNETLNLVAKDFDEAFSGDGHLISIIVTSLPISGKLTLNGIELEEGVEIPRGSIALVEYAPTDGFEGNDAFEWQASNGYDVTAEARFDVVVEDQLVTGIELKSGPVLEVYPNPANSFVYIMNEKSGLRSAPTAHLSMINYLGKRLVVGYRYEDGKIVADVSGLLPGFYLLQLQIGNEYFTKKVVIARTARN